MKKKKINKEEIIAEYLTGKSSYRALGEKYNMPHQTICDWVLKYEGKKLGWEEKETGQKEQDLPDDVKVLKKALRKSQLKNRLLEEILKLSEEQTGIDL